MSPKDIKTKSPAMAMGPCEATAIAMGLSFDHGYVSEFGHGFKIPK